MPAFVRARESIPCGFPTAAWEPVEEINDVKEDTKTHSTSQGQMHVPDKNSVLLAAYCKLGQAPPLVGRHAPQA